MGEVSRDPFAIFVDRLILQVTYGIDLGTIFNV